MGILQFIDYLEKEGQDLADLIEERDTELEELLNGCVDEVKIDLDDDESMVLVLKSDSEWVDLELIKNGKSVKTIDGNINVLSVHPEDLGDLKEQIIEFLNSCE